MAELNLVKARHAVTKEYSAEYVTMYENEAYTVFLVEGGEDGGTVRANVVNKTSEFPQIYVYLGGGGGVNVPALGTLNPSQVTEYIERLEIAKSTFEQTLKLMRDYWK